MANHATIFWFLVAVIETLIALALLSGFGPQGHLHRLGPVQPAGVDDPEGFGGPYMSGASDIGTAIIYVVVSAGLLTLAYYTGPDPYSVDHHIEKTVDWWWRVAEVRRPVPAQTTQTAPRPRVPVPSSAAHRHRRSSQT
jgi:hypothetical protein